jgi:hypothetical protein
MFGRTHQDGHCLDQREHQLGFNPGSAGPVDDQYEPHLRDREGSVRGDRR